MPGTGVIVYLFVVIELSLLISGSIVQATVREDDARERLERLLTLEELRREVAGEERGHSDVTLKDDMSEKVTSSGNLAKSDGKMSQTHEITRELKEDYANEKVKKSISVGNNKAYRNEMTHAFLKRELTNLLLDAMYEKIKTSKGVGPVGPAPVSKDSLDSALPRKDGTLADQDNDRKSMREYAIGPPGLWGRKDETVAKEHVAARGIRGPPGLWGKKDEIKTESEDELNHLVDTLLADLRNRKSEKKRSRRQKEDV